MWETKLKKTSYINNKNNNIDDDYDDNNNDAQNNKEIKKNIKKETLNDIISCIEELEQLVYNVQKIDDKHDVDEVKKAQEKLVLKMLQKNTFFFS